MYSKLQGTVFEDYISNYRTDRYNLMCYITSHDTLLPTYVDDESSGGGRKIPKNSTTAALESLGTTFNFIDCWIKHFHHNYQVIWKIYNEAIKDMFKHIPTKKSKPLSQDKKTSCHWQTLAVSATWKNG